MVVPTDWVVTIVEPLPSIKQMYLEKKQTFKDFKESTENIASNILTVRLNLLLENGLVSKSKIKSNNKSVFYCCK